MFNNYIDFDEASKEWMKNKRKLTNGRYEYICNYIHTNGKQCRRTKLSCQTKNSYIYGFGDNNYIDIYNQRRISLKGYKDHPNRDYYCKRHINRFNPLIYKI